MPKTSTGDLDSVSWKRRKKRDYSSGAVECPVPTATLAEVSRRISLRLGRSPETVRYTIKNHDAMHPKTAIFPTLRGALEGETKQRIFGAFRRGIPIEKLAEQYRRTRSTIYRVVNEMRAQRLLNQPIDYIPNPVFAKAGAEAMICGNEPAGDEKQKSVRISQICLLISCRSMGCPYSIATRSNISSAE